MKTYLTLDVGGSAIKYALIQEDLEILEKNSVPTPLDSLETFVETIGKLYDQYKDCIEGIAISMPGVIDPDKGFAYTGGALKYIVDLQLVDILKQRCPTNISIGNDAKCAANAEVGFGVLKDVDDAVLIILGTGIGGCLVKDRKVHTGKHFSAGEFSFMYTNADQHNDHRQVWSIRNGISGLLKRVQDELKTEEKFDGKQIFEMANQGNEDVLRALDLFTKDLAVQIYNIQSIFDPEKVAIGGGISAQPILFECLEKNLEKIVNQFDFPIKHPFVVPCHYRNDANLIGALYQHIQTDFS
ncbi:MAG: ROK family protein [Coprobacillus sp.]